MFRPINNFILSNMSLERFIVIVMDIIIHDIKDF